MAKHIDRFSKEDFDNSNSSITVRGYNLEIRDAQRKVIISSVVDELPPYNSVDELKLWIIKHLPITVSATAILEEKRNG